MTLAASTARWLPAPVKGALYRFKPLARLLRRLLNRATPEGITRVTVAAGLLEDWELLLNLRLEKDYWLGTYETALQQAIRDHVRPGMIIYDIGANIGAVSLMLARATGTDGKVLAVEALPANVERLRANTALNQPHAPIECLQAAASNTDQPVTFLVHRSTSMGKAAGSAGRDEQYSQSISVPGVTLDHLAFETGFGTPDLIKMDIEGGEVLALAGMPRLLAKVRPVMLIEIHGETAGDAVYDTLTKAGYRLCQIQTGYPTITARSQLDWKAYVVALPENQKVVHN